MERDLITKTILDTMDISSVDNEDQYYALVLLVECVIDNNYTPVTDQAIQSYVMDFLEAFFNYPTTSDFYLLQSLVKELQKI